MGGLAGELTADAASALGLRPGIAVAMSGIDAHAGMLGVGVVAPGAVALITGTSTCQLAQSATPVFDAGLCGPFECAVVDRARTIEAGQASTGGTVRWLMEIAGQRWPAERRYQSADAEAAEIAPGASSEFATAPFPTDGKLVSQVGGWSMRINQSGTRKDIGCNVIKCLRIRRRVSRSRKQAAPAGHVRALERGSRPHGLRRRVPAANHAIGSPVAFAPGRDHDDDRDDADSDPGCVCAGTRRHRPQERSSQAPCRAARCCTKSDCTARCPARSPCTSAASSIVVVALFTWIFSWNELLGCADPHERR